LAQFNLENDAPKGPQSVAESRKSTLSTLSVRPKGETTDAKRERKRMLKEYRRVIFIRHLLDRLIKFYTTLYVIIFAISSILGKKDRAKGEYRSV